MYFPNDEYRSSIILPFEFDAIRVFGTTMHPTSISLKVSVTPSHSDVRTPVNVEEKSNEGMQRLHFWVDTILSNVVMVDVNSDLFNNTILSIDNTTMFCPKLPTDHILVELLHSKISAITKGLFDIHAISIQSRDTNNIEVAFRDVDGYELPGIEYFPEKTFHSTPWWTRDTIEVCEFAKDDVVESELFNHFSDFFGKKEADIIIFRADTDDEDEDGQV